MVDIGQERCAYTQVSREETNIFFGFPRRRHIRSARQNKYYVQQQQPQQKFKFWRDGNSGSQCYLGIHGNQPPSSATEEGWKWKGEGETAGDGGEGGRRCFAQIRERRGRRKREEKKNRYQKTAGAAHPSSLPFPLPIPNLPGLEFTNKSANSFTLSVFKSDLKVRTFLSLSKPTFGEFYPPLLLPSLHPPPSPPRFVCST